MLRVLLFKLGSRFTLILRGVLLLGCFDWSVFVTSETRSFTQKVLERVWLRAGVYCWASTVSLVSELLPKQIEVLLLFFYFELCARILLASLAHLSFDVCLLYVEYAGICLLLFSELFSL